MARILLNLSSQFGGRPSGVAVVAFNLLRELLASTSHTYCLRTNWKESDLPSFLVNSRVEYMFCQRPKFVIFDVLAELARMPIRCLVREIDIVINMDPFGAPLGGRSRITVVHDAYFKTIAKSLGWRAALTSKLSYLIVLLASNRVVCISEATKRDVITTFPFIWSKATVIYNAASSEFCDPVNSRPLSLKRYPYILLVGNYTENKNFSFAAEAVVKLNAMGRQVDLVHVGRDPAGLIAATIGSAARPISLENRTGITEAQLAELYAGALCLVVPSTAEGFCLPIIEAQGVGCPVVCSRIEVLEEIGGAGMLTFSPREPQELLLALTRLLDDETLRAEMIESGKRNVERFSWRRSAEHYASVINELLVERGNA